MRNRSRSVLVVAALAVAALLLLATEGCGARAGASIDSAASDSARLASAADTMSPGEQLYQRCVPCHLATGEGVAGSYPSLVGKNLATASDPTAAIRIMLSGLQGPTTVNGVAFNALMPPYGTNLEMTDSEVATVLTWVRQAWGNGAGPVTPEQVARLRATAPPLGTVLTADSLTR